MLATLSGTAHAVFLLIELYTPNPNWRYIMHQFQKQSSSREICLRICSNNPVHVSVTTSPHLAGTQGSNSHMRGHALLIMPQNDPEVADLTALSILEECGNGLHGRNMTIPLQSGNAVQEIDSSPSSGYAQRDDTPQQAGESGSVEPEGFAPFHLGGPACSSGKKHVLEDISVGADGRQILRLPTGVAWTAKRITAGERAVQMIGAFSDKSMGD